VSVQSTQINVQDSESGDTVMTNLLISGELDSSGESRLDIGYNIGSDAINGRVTVSTPMTMVTASGDAWPNIGQMRIDGDGGSYVTLDANTGDINTVLRGPFSLAPGTRGLHIDRIRLPRYDKPGCDSLEESIKRSENARPGLRSKSTVRRSPRPGHGRECRPCRLSCG